jgi:aminotransferase in exopolysaccharide biosynthesis
LNNTSNFVAGVIKALHSVVGSNGSALHEPFFGKLEQKYLVDCLSSGYVSSIGSYVDKFENLLASYTGARNVIATVNGTSALHLALLGAGVTKEDEVLVPSLTFAATANAIIYCGAFPIFIDSSPVDLNIDLMVLEEWLKNNTYLKECQLINLKSGRRIKAIIPMHTFGHSCDMDSLMQLANNYHLVVVEDAAEALGSFYKKRHLGSIGKVGVLSFNGNKIITTGGGGAILTNDDELASQIRHLSTTARIKHPWEVAHDQIGFNYRMPNLNAALGCAQMERLDDFRIAKRALNEAYLLAFKNIANVHIYCESHNCSSNYWLQSMVLSEPVFNQKELILKETNAIGISTRPLWRLMHKLEHFSNFQKTSMDGAELLEKCIINIPSSPQLL